jgi:membrane-associated protease RseP (regulator of RpoE activity)
MYRSLSLGGVGLLVLALTSGVVFGKPPGHDRPSQMPARQHSHSRSPGSMSHANNGGKKAVAKNKKPGKPKPAKKTGNKKKNDNRKKYHKKHHKKHHKRSGPGGDLPDVSDLIGGAGSDDVGGPDGRDGDDGDDPEVEGTYGLLITDLDDDGPAAAAGLDVDDTILSVNGIRVQSAEQLRAAFKNAKGRVEVVYISDDTGEVEEVMVTPRNGRIGITMDEVEVN